jgi:hypothetical protein
MALHLTISFTAMQQPWSVAPFALLLLVLNGCERRKAPSSEQQLVFETVRKLREGFNKDCESFYQAAAVRDDQLQEDWIKGCERIRETLGPWNELNALTYSRLSGHPVSRLVEGRAVFGNGYYFLDTHWHVNNGWAHLYFFTVRGGKEEINLPRTPQRPLGPQDVPNPVGTKTRSNTSGK